MWRPSIRMRLDPKNPKMRCWSLSNTRCNLNPWPSSTLQQLLRFRFIPWLSLSPSDVQNGGSTSLDTADLEAKHLRQERHIHIWGGICRVCVWCQPSTSCIGSCEGDMRLQWALHCLQVFSILFLFLLVVFILILASVPEASKNHCYQSWKVGELTVAYLVVADLSPHRRCHGWLHLTDWATLAMCNKISTPLSSFPSLFYIRKNVKKVSLLFSSLNHTIAYIAVAQFSPRRRLPWLHLTDWESLAICNKMFFYCVIPSLGKSQNLGVFGRYSWKSITLSLYLAVAYIAIVHHLAVAVAVQAGLGAHCDVQQIHFLLSSFPSLLSIRQK